MSYDNIKLEYSKEKITIVEIDLDTCSLSSGVSPCSATQTGDNKCFNTFASCNDLPNYAKTTKTYRFCTGRSPHPIGLDAIPSLLSASISPAKIDLSGGLGTRASVSLTGLILRLKGARIGLSYEQETQTMKIDRLGFYLVILLTENMTKLILQQDIT